MGSLSGWPGRPEETDVVSGMSAEPLAAGGDLEGTVRGMKESCCPETLAMQQRRRKRRGRKGGEGEGERREEEGRGEEGGGEGKREGKGRRKEEQ